MTSEAAAFWAEAGALARAALAYGGYLRDLGLESLEVAIPQAAPRPAVPPAAAETPEPLAGRGGERPFVVFVGATPAIFGGEQGALLAGIIEKGFKTLGEDDYYVTSLARGQGDWEGDFPARAAEAGLPRLKGELRRLTPRYVLSFGPWPTRYLSGRRKETMLLLRDHRLHVADLPGMELLSTYALEDMAATPALKGDMRKKIAFIMSEKAKKNDL